MEADAAEADETPGKSVSWIADWELEEDLYGPHRDIDIYTHFVQATLGIARLNDHPPRDADERFDMCQSIMLHLMGILCCCEAGRVELPDKAIDTVRRYRESHARWREERAAKAAKSKKNHI